MITVITGGSGSGKSEYAESVLLATKVKYQYYLATMEVFGEEDQKKVDRHKKLRAGKGFAAIERPRDLAGVDFQSPWEETAVLVECIANLTANEFFAYQGGRNAVGGQDCPRSRCVGISGKGSDPCDK